MQKNICPFGPAFVRLRTERQLTQWHVSASAKYHVTNLSKVEKGTHQPGVMLALRLVALTGADVGEFFRKLWEHGSTLASGADAHQGDMPSVDMAALSAEGV